MKKVLRIIFIPASLFLWFIYSYSTLEKSCDSAGTKCELVPSTISLLLLIALLVIYTYPIFKFLIKKFNLKAKAHWFFYYFLASAIVILLSETVPFLDNLEVNGPLALLIIVSCGISFILSLSFGVQMFVDKKLSRK